MAKNAMPERIYAWGAGAHAGWEDASVTDRGSDTEYVRADLAAGDANEPLAEGQFRWVSLGGERQVAVVINVGKYCGRNEASYRTINGVTCFGFQLDCIGPVIRPPEGA